jgi:hypothetical protein
VRAAVRTSPCFPLPLRRAASACLALAFFASPVLEVAHSARAHHAACPEDGELVDVVLEAPEIAHSDEGAVLPGAQDATGAHQHRHCYLAARAQKSRSAQAQVGLQAPSPVEVVAGRGPPRTVAFPARIPVYRLAPKISPPLA